MLGGTQAPASRRGERLSGRGTDPLGRMDVSGAMTRLAEGLRTRRAVLYAGAMLVGLVVRARAVAEPEPPPTAPAMALPLELEVSIIPPAVAPPQQQAVMEVAPDLGLTAEPRVVERTGDVERVVAGALRAEVTGGRVVLADDRFAFGIIGATRTTTGWVFIAADGAVARSDRFLGPLQRLGDAPRPGPDEPAAPLSPTCGRLAFGAPDPRASLWTTDGSGPIAPARRAPPGVAISAAFGNARDGLIVLDGGELYVTHDGAASFDRIGLHGASATSVACQAGALRVTTSHGEIAFGLDARPGNARVAAPTPGTPGVRVRILAAALRRYGPLVAGAFGGVVDDDGVVLVPRGHALAPVETVSDSELAALTGERECKAARWGHGYALLCPRGIFRVDPRTLHGDPVSQDAIEAPFVRPAVDGIHLLAACRVFPDNLAPCTLVDGHLLWSGPDWSELAGISGDALVVLRQTPDANRLVLMDPTTRSDRRAFPVRLPPGTASIFPWSLEMTPDGATAIGVAAPTDPSCEACGRWVVQVAVSDGSTTAARLPDGATRAGFITAELGVAAGRDASKLWVTYDRGAHWEALDPGVDGIVMMPERVSETGGFPPDYGVQCDRRRCAIDGRVVVRFERPCAAIDRVFASHATRPAEVLWTTSRTDLAPIAVGPDLPDVSPEQSDEFLLDSTGHAHYGRSHVDAALHVTLDGRWKLAWSGFDWRGAYATRRAAGTPAWPRSASAQVRLVRATRDGVVMLHISERTRVVWIPVGGRPVEIVDDRLYPSAADDTAIDDLLTLPDGTLAILFSSQRSDETTGYRRLLHVGRDGRVLARRTFHLPVHLHVADDNNPGIAFIGRVVGMQWAPRDQTRPRWFFPITGAARRPAPSVESDLPPTTCPVGAHGAVTILVGGLDNNHFYLRGNATMCLQAFELGNDLEAHHRFAIASQHGDARTTVTGTPATDVYSYERFVKL